MIIKPARRFWWSEMGQSASLVLYSFAIIFATSLSALVLRPAFQAEALTCTSTVATLTQTSSPIFYIDDGYTNGYTSFKIDTGSSGAFTDLWVKVDSFSSSNLQLASTEDGLYRVGAISANSSANIYYYLKGTATGTAQTYTLRLYEGKPGSGGTETCTSAQSNTAVESTIQASSNKVTSVNYTAPYLGGDFTVTVIGDSGTIGAKANFSYTPATQAGWSADCLELKGTSITLSGGNTGTYTGGLYISGLSSSDTHYVVNYVFKVKCVTASSTAVVPLSYIASGNDLKHTNTTNYGSLPPIAPANNSVYLNKTVSPGYSSNGGTTTYSVDIINSGATSATLDDIVDILPSSPTNASYVSTSSLFDNDISDATAAISLANPAISGQTLTWLRQFTIAAGKTARLTYQVTIPSTAGSYTNSAVAHIGTTQVDKTVLTTDNVPATATYGVGSISLSSSTKTAVDINGGSLEPGDTIDYSIDVIAEGSGTATGVSVSDSIDSDTENITNLLIGANGTVCGSSYIDSSTSSSISITNMEIPTGSHCLITYKATIKSVASDGSAVLNTATITLTNPGGIGASPSSVPMTVQRNPVLALTITENDADNVVTAGQTVTYTMKILNTGLVAANGVDLTATVSGPISSLGTPILTNCGSAYVDTTALPNVNIAGLAIASAGTCTITFTATVTSGTTTGQVDVSADITAAREGGSNPDPVDASTLLIGATPTAPDLSGTITDDDLDDVVEPGQTVTYTATISNAGQTDATTSAIIIVDSRYGTPSGISYVGCGSPTSSFVAPNLNLSSISVVAGSTCTVTYSVTLTSPINEGVQILEAIDINQASQGGNNPASVSAPALTVNATPILTLSKTSNTSGSVSPGQEIDYTVEISNSGNGEATGIDLTDSLSGDVSSVSNITLTNCGSNYVDNTAGTAVSISSISVPAGQTCTVEYTATVSSSAAMGSNISNSVEITSSTEGSNIPPSASAGTYTVAVSPDLSVTKTENDADDNVTPGQTVTYTITISNSSSASGTTSFTDVIDSGYSSPSNLQFSNCGGSPSSSFVGSTLSASSLVVSNANPCVVTYDVVVDSSAANNQSLENSVDVAAASEGGNNPAPVASSSLTVDSMPSISTTNVASDINGGTLKPGDTVRYTITINNNGTGDGTGIDVSSLLDSDLTGITNVTMTNCGSSTNSSTSSSLSITNITVTNSSDCVITYDAVVENPSIEGETITNTVDTSAPSEGGSSSSTNANTLTVDVTPVLAITTTANPSAGNVTRGQTITYTTTISNTGDGPATIDLSGTVTGSASNITNVNLQNCGSASTNSTSGLSLSITALKISTTTSCVVTYQVTVLSNAANDDNISLTTQISAASEGGSAPGPTPAIVQTVKLPNLTVSKTSNDSDGTVTPNQTVHYTIEIENTSLVNGTTSLVDDVPSGFSALSGLTFTSCGGSVSTISTSPDLALSNLIVSAGGTCTVEYDVTVSSSATTGTTLTNTVDVAASNEGGNDPAAVSASTLTVYVPQIISPPLTPTPDPAPTPTPGPTPPNPSSPPTTPTQDGNPLESPPEESNENTNDNPIKDEVVDEIILNNEPSESEPTTNFVILEPALNLMSALNIDLPTPIQNTVAGTGTAVAAVAVGWGAFQFFGAGLSMVRSRGWLLLGYKPPKVIRAKDFNIDAKIEVVHPKSKNKIKLPRSKKHASWAAHSVQPGDAGVSVIMGQALENSAFSNLREMPLDSELEVEFNGGEWKKFKVQQIKFVTANHIQQIFTDHLPRVDHQLNVAGQLEKNHSGGRWILLEAKEITNVNN